MWLIATSKIHISDPNKENKPAGGGVFVHYDEISKKQASIYIDTDVLNQSINNENIKIETRLCDAKGNVLKTIASKINLKMENQSR